ncbi:hypothetical protein Y032_0005g2460 [Ancylostoma ceylanicum]|uniref:Uncharacterized protein n=1 Tax=Ancylostoma ceylanicum TaxID=53326 RepID=A0A016VRD9_9BILA|nr:hypothetical protein Y032_0005g2460 [Ancylostoma ceylanicum]
MLVRNDILGKEKIKSQKCSTTCGQGVRHREVFCERGRRMRAPDSACDPARRPATTANCYLTACPAYHWSTTPWSKVSEAVLK